MLSAAHLTRKRAEALQMEGFVYVVEAADRLKIGWTAYPETRFAKLERTTGEELYVWACVPGTRADEAWLHERWRAHRIEGEWFHVIPALLLVCDRGELLDEAPQRIEHVNAPRGAA